MVSLFNFKSLLPPYGAASKCERVEFLLKVDIELRFMLYGCKFVWSIFKETILFLEKK